MIFCEQPCYNEPISGFNDFISQKRPDFGQAAERYNQRIKYLTMEFAILYWIEHPPKLWKDIMDSYFKRNAAKIRDTIGKWARESQRSSCVFQMHFPLLTVGCSRH
jgi:hypothetical protein